MKVVFGFLVAGLLLATQVYPCHVTVNGWITGTDQDPIPGDQFRVVANKNGRISSTNPGGFLYHISITTTEWALDSATITAFIPSDFELHGGRPVKVFLDGTQIYAGSSLSFTVPGIPVNSEVLMQIHLKYGLIGSVADPSYYPHTYYFDAGFDISPEWAMVGNAYAELTGFLQ